VNKTHGAVCAAALALAGLLGGGLSGCSTKVDTDKTPSVTKVEATTVDNDVTPEPTKDQVAPGVLDKQQLEDMLLERVASDTGQTPDTVDCLGDLVAQPGETVECTVATDLAGQVYIVTTTTVEGDTVNFDYAPKP
jgi:hypothetical protein